MANPRRAGGYSGSALSEGRSGPRTSVQHMGDWGTWWHSACNRGACWCVRCTCLHTAVCALGVDCSVRGERGMADVILLDELDHTRPYFRIPRVKVL